MVEGTKHSKAGVISQEWKAVSFGSICTVSKTRINPITSAKTYKCIELEHLDQGTGILTGHVLSNALRSQKSIFEVGDILFGKLRPYLKKYYLADFEGVCTTEIWVLKSGKEIDNRYLYQLVQSDKFIQAANISTGTKMPRAEWKIVSEIEVPLPPTKAEQTAIATALNDADALITQLEQLLAKKRNIKIGAMQELLRPNPDRNREGWEVKKLGEVGECIIGLTYSPSNVRKEGLLVLRSSNIQGNRLAFEDNVFVNVEVSERLKVRKGDILICVRNGSRNLIGKCAYLDGRAVGETFGAFMSIFRSPFNDYIFHVLQSSHIQKQIEETIGATINQLTNKNLNSFEIPFPSPQEQNKIAKILSDMDTEIQELEKKIEKYKKVKQGMMQVLLTGKVRLV